MTNIIEKKHGYISLENLSEYKQLEKQLANIEKNFCYMVSQLDNKPFEDDILFVLSKSYRKDINRVVIEINKLIN